MPKKTTRDPKPKNPRYPAAPPEEINPLAGVLLLSEDAPASDPSRGAHAPSRVVIGALANDSESPSPESAIRNQQSAIQPHFSAPGLWLYHDNCLAVLDAIHQKYPEGRFDCIFADPPYFLSNGGITCHAGKMVKVHKGDWDQSRGWEWNHEFNTEWLRRCQRVLKPNGTIWVTGTHHVIFSVGFAMQQLGYKILNDIAWEKPNPPPNLSCRYFTHSTETIIWAAKNEKSKHTFNYQAMRQVTGKQMKTVWRKEEFFTGANRENGDEPRQQIENPGASEAVPSPPSGEKVAEGRMRGQSAIANPQSEISSIWTMTAPGNAEKTHGKHPTQKPIALIERCLLAATNPGDLVLDPFLGGGTTLVACIRLNRRFVGIDLEHPYLSIAIARADAELIATILRSLRISTGISIFLQNDLDPSTRSMDRIRGMADDAPKADCIFHETKFVFLSCAVVSSASVVHTTVDVSLQEAWAKTPTGKKRETTHIVRCETEIFRITPK